MSRSAVLVLVLSSLWSSACGSNMSAGSPSLTPLTRTAPVGNDPDDPAIWVHPGDASRSVVLGTNKVAAAEGGALYVFGLDGSVRQTIAPLDRPNNVDVEYGLAGPKGPMDIAVVTERYQHRLRVFTIEDGRLAALDGGRGIPVLEGQQGDASEPMGIALYKRPRDGAMFAIVAPKTGGTSNYLWQYRIEIDPASGQARGTLVRRFGDYSGTSEIEAVAVDDALGFVYYSDEEFAIRKWQADPDHPDAAHELTAFGRTEFKQQREGIGILSRPDGTGFIVVSDQIPNGTELKIYPREGRPGRQHEHEPALATVVTPADSTDGLDVVSSALDGRFGGGALVMMNSSARNFLMFKWDDVAAAITAGR
jgi:3-phytase